MKQVVKTIPAKTIAGCNGGADVTIPAQDYTAVEIMTTPGDFSVVSFRVYNSDDLSTVKYSFMNRTPAQVNFNSTSGEIRFTMTGISQLEKNSLPEYISMMAMDRCLKHKSFSQAKQKQVLLLGQLCHSMVQRQQQQL
ncbi:MAG: hypothetical protein IPK11_16540 [Ignavibacteria bacterium]|nr:hypothetical protein [Ignavibacteria bacterium]